MVYSFLRSHLYTLVAIVTAPIKTYLSQEKHLINFSFRYLAYLVYLSLIVSRISLHVCCFFRLFIFVVRQKMFDERPTGARIKNGTLALQRPIFCAPLT